MTNNLEKNIQSILMDIMSDGFNRSIIALEDAGAIDTREMKKEYHGIGSKYYDLVSKELEYTAKYATKSVIKKLTKELQHHI